METAYRLVSEEVVKAQIAQLAYHIERNPADSLSLASGELGKVLYYFYCARLLGEEAYATKGSELLQRILRQVNQGQSPRMRNPILSSGLAGLGLTLEILVNEGFIEDELDNYLESIDKYIFEGALQKIEAGDTDFLHGGVGGIHYLYYRLEKNPAVRHYLIALVQALDRIAIKHEETAYFPNVFMQTWQKAAPDLVVIGLSHGMIAATLVLINLMEASILPETTSRLVQQCVNFILKCQNTRLYQPGVYARFPNAIFLGEDLYSARNLENYLGGLRWCYGDLNVTHLLYKASQAFQSTEWLDLAHQTGLATLAIQDVKQAYCHGSLFCHGASGIAYYYQYLSRISGEPAYMKGYECWFRKALELMQEEVTQEKFTSISGHFLEGFVGSSLVLLSALDTEAPYWEKIWLLS